MVTAVLLYLAGIALIVLVLQFVRGRPPASSCPIVPRLKAGRPLDRPPEAGEIRASAAECCTELENNQAEVVPR